MYLTALIKSKPGNAEALESHLYKLVAASRADIGCEQYDLYRSAEDKNLFIFQEQWKDEEALQNHNKQPHLIQFQADIKDLIDGEVSIYKQIKIA